MTEHIPDCGEAKRQAIRQSKLEALQRGIDAYEAEHPYCGPDGKFARRLVPEPYEDAPIVAPRRYLISPEGQAGLLIAAFLLVGLAFAMLAHP